MAGAQHVSGAQVGLNIMVVEHVTHSQASKALEETKKRFQSRIQKTTSLDPLQTFRTHLRRRRSYLLLK